ncbi:MAG: glycine-rich protein [Candidatus Cybelea sp.]
MRAFKFYRYALGIGAAASLLSACGGGSSVPVSTGSTVTGAGGLKNHQTFSYTGNEQTFIVPAGVRRLTVVAHGGKGDGNVSYGYTGFPGRVYAVIPVHSGEKLYVFVGASGTHGGFNGGGVGGAPGSGTFQGYTGGGASDVRMGSDKLKDRIIVAAGGGGSGDSFSYGYAAGGNGGGLVGKSGGVAPYGGGGGGGGGATQSQAGSGGAGGLGSQSGGNGQPGSNGSLGFGGNGGDGGPGNGCGSYGLCYGSPGGGGGGGYYGGGGGGGGGAGYASSGRSDGSQGGGGGGGSSYVEPRAITSRMWTGWRATGDGSVMFLWN